MSKAHSIAPVLTPKFIDRFWSFVAVAGPEDCFLWQGSVHEKGYGQFNANGKTRRAHILARYLATGEWPGELCTLHTCDTRLCCRPSHLFLGTPAINSADMVAKGRSTWGDRNPSRLYPDRVARGERKSHLTEADVREIRSLYAAGNLSMPAIGLRFGLCRQSTAAIIHRVTWKHVL